MRYERGSDASVVWTFAFDALGAADVREAVAEIEGLGYPSVWVPEGGSSREIFAHLSLLAAATRDITVCSGIANVTARHPEAMAGGARTLADAFGERVVLGIGIGHQYTAGRRGQEWADPVGRMRSYLDAMDAASMGPSPEVPVRRLLAALGPRMLGVAAERALGAHTYFVPVEHTAGARELLGPEPVLAVEQTVVVSTDPEVARGSPAPGRLTTWDFPITRTTGAGWATRTTSMRVGVTGSSTPRSRGATCPRSRAACASTWTRVRITSASR